MHPERGIDVSRHQGTIDWHEVAAAGIGFAYVKATEGASHVDPRFLRNWHEAKAAGVRCGAYHFFAPGSDVGKQVARFTATVTHSPGDLPPVLDLETQGQDWSAVPLNERVILCLQYLDGVRDALGVEPIVYTSKNAVNQIFADKPGKLVTYRLWVASYRQTAPPTMPKGWDSWHLWQYADTGSVGGIAGPVDLDRAADLNGPGVPVKPPPRKRPLPGAPRGQKRSGAQL